MVAVHSGRSAALPTSPLSASGCRPPTHSHLGRRLVLPLAVPLLACLLLAPASAVATSAETSTSSAPNSIALLAVQQAQLFGSDGTANDYFGSSVALCGDTALVGAPYDDVGGSADQGSVYVFTRSGSGWSQQTQLTAADGAADDYFGISVALSGETALVGAYYDDVGANLDQGSAYVFTRSGSNWSQQTQLTAADGAAGDLFGYSVALSGDAALVGAFQDSVGANAAQGSAYVFTRSGGNWSQQTQLTAADGTANDLFGYSVALSGETALVGASQDTVGGTTYQGSAYVFVRSGTSWSQQAQLLASDGAAGDFFGYSVALSGETALVGAYYDDVGANLDQGSAYVFTRSGSSWSQQTQLTAADGAADDYFGISVALSGDTALVGALYDDVGANANQGSADVFTRTGSSWSQQGKLTASDGVTNDFFGRSVVLSGDTALVGAPYDDVGANVDQGSAYPFLLDSTAPTTTASGLQADDHSGWINHSQSVSLSATDVGGSGVAHTYYTLDGGGQQTYGGAFEVSGAGSHTITYWSVDAAGNEETHHGGYVNIDTTGPITGATGLQADNHSGWRSSAQTVTLSPTDVLSGVAHTYYTLDGGGQQPYSGSFEAFGSGSHTITFWSTDAAGNEETHHSGYVNIDTTRPTTKAYAASAKHNKTVTLYYKVDDVSGASASVTIKIYKGTKLKKTLSVGVCACNAKLPYPWKCTLAKGSYTLKVYATDAAGNTQKTPVGSAKLTVK